MWDDMNSDPCDACEKSRSQNMSICDEMEDSCLDKENVQPYIKNEDLSMYDSNITPPPCTDCSPSHCRHQHLQRRSLDDHDSNTQDSGYQGERFSSYVSPGRAGSSTGSFGGSSLSSVEEDFLDLYDMEALDKPGLPHDFNKLIANPLINKPKLVEKRGSPGESIIRPLFRRALSLQNAESDITPNSSRVRTSLFKAGDEVRSFKRPEPPSVIETGVIKKSKMFDSDGEEEAFVPVARPILQRAFSATEESIMCAVQRSSAEPDLIGDFSRGFCLPLTLSRHPDLKAISSHTLSQLIKGDFSDAVHSFKVIDCRYPYEFDGGHIEGAINVYTKEQCIELLERYKTTSVEQQQKQILVFHCEFSSERGPNLYRYLRKEDRQRNMDSYPSLCYPEIYLLEGGYKSFYEKFSSMCAPVAYKEMLHPDHEDDLKHFRQKSKTWNCDTRQRSQQGRSLKRLGM